jgi:site-specific recombinase XerD
MDHTEALNRYRRFLMRVNYSKSTVGNYTSIVKLFLEWVKLPVDEVSCDVIFEYISVLHHRRLEPKTINCHLDAIRKFYNYMKYEERRNLTNPVKNDYRQIMPKPLPKFLKEQELRILLSHITDQRDLAICLLMLRCGLRVGEVANLTLPAIDFERRSIVVLTGKFRKDRLVYMSDDTINALHAYMEVRPPSKARHIFLTQKGLYKGKPLSIRGIQKRIEKYARRTGVSVSCHRFRHTMATQLLNADAMLVTIQEVMGHECVSSTQRYAKLSNTKVRRDYFKAMAFIMADHRATG